MVRSVRRTHYVVGGAVGGTVVGAAVVGTGLVGWGGGGGGGVVGRGEGSGRTVPVGGAGTGGGGATVTGAGGTVAGAAVVDRPVVDRVVAMVVRDGDRTGEVFGALGACVDDLMANAAATPPRSSTTTAIATNVNSGDRRSTGSTAGSARPTAGMTGRSWVGSPASTTGVGWVGSSSGGRSFIGGPSFTGFGPGSSFGHEVRSSPRRALDRGACPHCGLGLASSGLARWQAWARVFPDQGRSNPRPPGAHLLAGFARQ